MKVEVEVNLYAFFWYDKRHMMHELHIHVFF